MVLGTYKEALSARSTEQKILDVSQDGGIVSALLCYALDEGIIEGAVVAGTPDEDWRPIPTVVTSSDEVIAAAGTKYSMSPTLSVLKEATRQYALPAPTQGGVLMQVNPDTMPSGEIVAIGAGITIRHGESIISLPAGISAEAVADLVKALNCHA